jgi:hypothetical protein
MTQLATFSREPRLRRTHHYHRCDVYFALGADSQPSQAKCTAVGRVLGSIQSGFLMCRWNQLCGDVKRVIVGKAAKPCLEPAARHKLEGSLLNVILEHEFRRQAPEMTAIIGTPRYRRLTAERCSPKARASVLSRCVQCVSPSA